MKQVARMHAVCLSILAAGVLACGPLPEPVAKAAGQRAREAELQGSQALGAPLSLNAQPKARARNWNPALHAIVDEHIQLGLKHVEGKARARDFDVSVHVIELASGREWGARRADVAQIPASNMKLVTSAAALVLLGPGQDFVTPVEVVGEIQDGVLHGDLVLRAAGDPIVDQHGDARVEGRLDIIAAALLQQGVRRISGDVVLDEGDFAQPAPAPGWPPANQYWQEHCALAAGFSLNGAVLQARVIPSQRGGKASVSVNPAPHGLRSNYGVASSGAQLNVQVGASTNAVTVKGEIPKKHPPYLADFSHPDPVELFGRVLVARLEHAGLRLDGQLRRQRGVAPGRTIAHLRSSLDDVLVPINTYSRNSVADQLLLALGHALGGAGSFEQGALVTQRALEELGVSSAGFHQADGSGLSRDNRVTARQLTSLIAAVLQKDPETRRVFLDSLAKNGQEGSLKERMPGAALAGRVFAKTGWITGASAISGLCLTEDGEQLVFSILIGYPPALGGLNTLCFKPMQDALVSSLVTGKP